MMFLFLVSFIKQIYLLSMSDYRCCAFLDPAKGEGGFLICATVPNYIKFEYTVK